MALPQYVTDTHALIWHLQRSRKLSAKARALFRKADRGEARIVIPSIVLVEMVYLAERMRIDPGLVDRVFALLAPRPQNYILAPLGLEVVRALRGIRRTQVPDMPDRIIVATAKQLGLALLSRDPAIAAVPGLSVIW